jgi:AbrB family looped-hinge helix DNA binding protein
MKVSTKGQVTIPQDIRVELGLHPGSEVAFEVNGDEARLIPVRKAAPRRRRISELLLGKGTVRMTTDEIMALTRGEP